MSPEDLIKKIFLVNYFLFIATILLLPVVRNIYSLVKYNMSFPKYDKYIIDKFCEDATCRYMAKFMIAQRIAMIFFMIFSTILVYCATFAKYEYNMYMHLCLVITTFVFNVLTVLEYSNWLYDRCVITDKAILIRSIQTKYIFYTIQLCDISQYGEFSFTLWDSNILLITKSKRKVVLLCISNRGELISVLRKLSNGIEIGKR